MSRDSATPGDAGLPETTFYHGSQGWALGAPGTGRQNRVLGTGMSSHCMRTRHPSVSPTQGSAASASQGETFQTRDSKARSGGGREGEVCPADCAGDGPSAGSSVSASVTCPQCLYPASPRHPHSHPPPSGSVLAGRTYWGNWAVGCHLRRGHWSPSPGVSLAFGAKGKRDVSQASSRQWS